MIISPRVACLLAVFLALVVVLDLAYGATHHRAFPVRIDPCALVATHEQQECR